MPERQESGEYKNRHRKSISLESYRGVGNGIMELNAPIADQFMSTADMRNDIVILQKPHDRVREYDEVGSVKVAKLLKLPSLNLWKGDGIVSTKKEGDTILIAIDDQEISQRVADKNDGKKSFDELFVGEFQREVRRGLSTCLKIEKLLNGGSYGLGFITAQGHFILWDLYVIPGSVGFELINGTDPLVGISRIAASVGIAHIGGNAITWVAVVRDKARESLYKASGRVRNSLFSKTIPDDPFVKRNPVDFVMPTVPIDKLIRGELYLAGKGRKLIKKA